MKVLVDTHVLLWILRGERLLTRAALRALDEAENCCYSIVSLWEIATKVSIGKLPLPSDWCDEFSSTLASHGYQRISAEQLQVIVGAVELAIAQPAAWTAPSEYTAENVSQTVSKILLGYLSLRKHTS